MPGAACSGVSGDPPVWKRTRSLAACHQHPSDGAAGMAWGFGTARIPTFLAGKETEENVAGKRGDGRMWGCTC